MNKSFTIIVPCYNTEEYISKCLDSLIMQNYQKELLQILIIDDGSTNDGIKHIVDSYILKYSNIEYYYKENNHWGSVINYVLNNKLAKKDYVSILDSDDFLDRNCFHNINNIIKNHDVLVGSCKKWNGTKNMGYFSPFYFPLKRKITNKIQMQTPICLPMLFFCKKEVFYKTKNLTEGIAHQDGDYIAQMLMNASNIFFTYKVIGYYYYFREGNSMNQIWDDIRFNAELNSCKKFINYDAQELIAFRLNVKEFKKKCKKEKIIFTVDRKFDFSWLPFYFKFFYNIIFFLFHKKFFNIKIK